MYVYGGCHIQTTPFCSIGTLGGYNLRYMAKLDEKSKMFDPIFEQLNDLYSSGAVEGYTQENLFSNKIYPFMQKYGFQQTDGKHALRHPKLRCQSLWIMF